MTQSTLSSLHRIMSSLMAAGRSQGILINVTLNDWLENTVKFSTKLEQIDNCRVCVQFFVCNPWQVGHCGRSPPSRHQLGAAQLTLCTMPWPWDAANRNWFFPFQSNSRLTENPLAFVEAQFRFRILSASILHFYLYSKEWIIPHCALHRATCLLSAQIIIAAFLTNNSY